MLRAEPTVQFATIAPAGFELLRALASCGYDLTITSGTDGEHSGPADPHHLGCAYDVRSHDLDADHKSNVLFLVMSQLGSPTPGSGGLVTDKFFGWLEQAGTADEHFHFQLRHGAVYP